MECGELIDEDDELTPEAICNQVSLDLYSKSSDFFGSPQDGITVWRVRVAQELFGELKPAPEVFWPPEAEMAARRAMMRDALSAMTLPVANANPALATSPLRASAPILMDAPTNLTRMRREFFASGIAASLIIGVTGLTSGYAFWGAISASPRTPTISARTASAEFSPEKAPGLRRSPWPRLGSRRANAHNAGPFWRCKRSFRATSSGNSPGRRDASRDRRDEARASAGFRGGARGAGGSSPPPKPSRGNKAKFFQRRNASWSKPFHHAQAKADGRFTAVNETRPTRLPPWGARSIPSPPASPRTCGGFLFNFHP